MIDLSKIKYRVVVMDEKGAQYNIRDFIQNLGWEENENELSVRSSFTAKNDKTSQGYLSGIIKPGCLIGIFATDGGSLDEEVARGYVETWNPIEKNSGYSLKCTNYDELYKLQKSQDNRFFLPEPAQSQHFREYLTIGRFPRENTRGQTLLTESWFITIGICRI